MLFDEQISPEPPEQNLITPSVTEIVATKAIKANTKVNNPIGKRNKRSVRRTRRKTI